MHNLAPFDRYRCIFVHIPKTGGIAVARSLFDAYPGGHVSLQEFESVYSKAELATYFKFTFVRNPWDRLVSAYAFLKAGGFNEYDGRWARTHLARYGSFDVFVREWINERNIYKLTHFIPQSRFVCLEGRRLGVDFVGRFETIDEDFRHVRIRLGIDARLQRMNTTPGRRADYRSYYSDETARIVADVYSNDIELFGYDFDNSHVNAARGREGLVGPGPRDA